MVAKTKKSSKMEMVNPTLLTKAITALLAHHSDTSSKSALLGDDLPVQVQFTLAKIPEQTSPRPLRIQIPHPLHKLTGDNNDNDASEGLEEIEACLIVKDSSKEWIKPLIAKLSSSSPALASIKKVLTLTSLRKKYTQYKDRRELLKTYTHFIADDRILPMLGKLLGKSFFQEKKQPIPIKITRKEALPYTIEKCFKSTYLFISPGTCLSVKAGNTSMDATKLVENIMAIVGESSEVEGMGAVKYIPRKWANVSAIHVKTSQSVALPVYNKTREELEEIAKLAKVDVSHDKDVKGGNSNKRAREEEEEEEEAEVVLKEKKKKKKDLQAKSPLVKALKKQQKEKKEKAEAEVEAEAEADLEEEEVVKSKATPSKKKKKKRSESVGDEEMDVDADSEVVKTPKSSKKKKKKTVEDTPKSAKKKKTTDDSTSTASEESKEYMASKKFKGSKKGYVYKMGPRGVGYYRDVKPVVDKAAMDAIRRMGGSGGGGGGNSSGLGGRRRSSVGGKGRKGGRKGRRSI